MERKRRTASRFGVKSVCEASFDAGALIKKGQRSKVCRKIVGKSCAILLRLPLNAGQRVPYRFSFHNSRRFMVNVEEVVCEAVSRLQSELANSYTTALVEVYSVGVLDAPSCLRQQFINFLCASCSGVIVIQRASRCNVICV